MLLPSALVLFFHRIGWNTYSMLFDVCILTTVFEVCVATMKIRLYTHHRSPALLRKTSVPYNLPYKYRTPSSFRTDNDYIICITKV